MRSALERLARAKDKLIRVCYPNFCFCCATTGYICSTCEMVNAAQDVLDTYRNEEKNRGRLETGLPGGVVPGVE